MPQQDTLTKVLAWIALVIGVVIVGIGALSLFGVVTPAIVRIFGSLAAVVLGVFLAFWGVQKLRGQADPIKQARASLLEVSSDVSERLGRRPPPPPPPTTTTQPYD